MKEKRRRRRRRRRMNDDERKAGGRRCYGRTGMNQSSSIWCYAVHVTVACLETLAAP